MYSRLAALWSEFSAAITIFDKPEKVLKKAGLSQVPTGTTLILSTHSKRPLENSGPARFAVTVMPILTPMPMQPALILTLMIASEILFAFVGSVQGLFFDVGESQLELKLPFYRL